MPNGLLTKDSTEIAPDKVTSDADGMKHFSVLISLIPSTTLDTLTISSYLKHLNSALPSPSHAAMPPLRPELFTPSPAAHNAEYSQLSSLTPSSLPLLTLKNDPE